jgi:transposase-like protein
VSTIPKNQLKAFYQEVGRLTADFLGSLECPNCKDESSIDWLFEAFSNGKPQYICRNCGKHFLIKGLKFKQKNIEQNNTKKPTFPTQKPLSLPKPNH